MKKLLAILLVLAMLISMMPIAMADEMEMPAPNYEWYGNGSDEVYNIDDIGDLSVLPTLSTVRQKVLQRIALPEKPSS